LPIGNCSVGDLRKTWLEAVAKNKVRATSIGITSVPGTGAISPVPMQDMSLTVNSPGADFLLGYSLPIYIDQAGQLAVTQLYVDGFPIGKPKTSIQSTGGSYPTVMADNFPIYLSSGTHKIEVFWFITTSGYIHVYSTNASMFAIEL
jgi:hypothetical protein